MLAQVTLSRTRWWGPASRVRSAHVAVQLLLNEQGMYCNTDKVLHLLLVADSYPHAST